MRKIVAALSIVGLLTLFVPVRADENAKVREIVERAIKAHGGTDLLTKYKASISKEKGKLHLAGAALDFTSETSFQLPVRRRAEAHYKATQATIIQVIDGKKGWLKEGNETEEMNKEMLALAKEEMYHANISHLICLKDNDYKLSPLEEVKVGDRPAIGIRVKRKGYRDVNLFFDKDKSLLLKMEVRVKDLAGQEYTFTKRYDDYRKVKGMMFPYKFATECDGEPYVEAEVTEVKIAEKLDDNVFAKP
jgi:hypothetical protein